MLNLYVYNNFRVGSQTFCLKDGGENYLFQMESMSIAERASKSTGMRRGLEIYAFGGNPTAQPLKTVMDRVTLVTLLKDLKK